jgi:hypothetical protein
VHRGLFALKLDMRGNLLLLCVTWQSLAFSPPLDLNRWYAGRAMIALLLPIALLIYGFYVSLGGQPILGSALKEE